MTGSECRLQNGKRRLGRFGSAPRLGKRVQDNDPC